MKILMVDNDSDNRLFALFAFKDLNVAHSMDFVSNSDELSDYFTRRLSSNSQLPDLVLIDSNLSKDDKLDSLISIRSNPRLKHLKTIAFSISTANRNSSLNVNESGELVGFSKEDELVWIFKEIRDELVDKPGWEYLIERPGSSDKMLHQRQSVQFA
ncbi:MAG: hypothetical protein ABL895_08505 [Cyclobacteriaceae bacterium]